MNRKIRIYIEVACHVLIWSVPTWLILRYNLVSYGGLTGEHYRIPLIISVFINIILVYGNILALFPAYNRKKLSQLNYWLLLILAILVTALIKVKVQSSFINLYNLEHSTAEAERLIPGIIVNSFFVIQSFLYCIVKEWIKNRAIERRLREEKLTLELKFLKSQINPHFLFNTLNNLYSVALKNNDNDTAEGITKLSNIMRFMLDDVNENMIPLEKEIRYLQSYIDLQKLRFSPEDNTEISFDVTGDISNKKVPSFMFVVFIENAFKHGIDYRKHSFINIKFDISDNKLTFSIKNSINKKDETHYSGIGLRNIKERLALIYPGNYDLQITSDNNIFCLELVINIPPE